MTLGDLYNNIKKFGRDTFSGDKYALPYANTSKDTNLAQTGAKKLYNFGAGVANHIVTDGIIRPFADIADNVAAQSYGLPTPQYNQLKSGAFKLGTSLAGQGAQNPQQLLADVGQTALPILEAWGGGKIFGAAKQGFVAPTIKKVAQQSSIQGMKVGGLTGLAQGLNDNRNTQDLTRALLSSGGQGLFGAAAGGALGYATPYAGRELRLTKADLAKLLDPKTQNGIKNKFIPSGPLISSGGDHPQMNNPDYFNPQSLLFKGMQKLDEQGVSAGLSIKATPTPDLPGQIKPPVRTTMNKETAKVVRKNLKAGRDPFTGVVKSFKKGEKVDFKPKPYVNPDGTIYQRNDGQWQFLKDNGDGTSLIRNTNDIAPVKVQNSEIGMIGKNQQKRGLTESVHTAGNVSPETKLQTQGFYAPKKNADTLGEARAFLADGGKVDFDKVKGLDKKVMAAMQEAINLDKQGNPEAAANLFNNLSEHATELGRGVQAFAMLDKMSPESIALSLAGRIKKYNETASKKIPELGAEHMGLISDFIKQIDGMPAGREKNIAINEFNKKLGEFIPTSTATKVMAVWKAGLLTSLRTHERNLLGNTIMQGAEVVKDIPASMADSLMSVRTGKRTVTATISGLREFGSKATRQQIKDLVMRGYDPAEDIGKFDIDRNITWDKNSKVQQFFKKYTEAVFRPLGAEDRAFFNAAYKRSLYDQAGAEAINAGKKGDAKFIKKLVENPTEEMLVGAMKDANYATFHDKNVLGGTAATVKRWLASQEGVKGDVGKVVGELLMPFTGVPSSIAGKTVAYSPVGLLKGSYDMGKVLIKDLPELQRQAAQEIGRGVMGTGLYGLGAYLMSQGLMTGQPKDAKEADLWAAQGKQANSVLIGGKWRSINSIGPQNLAMLAGAKVQEMRQDPEGSVGELMFSLGKDQLDQTFLKGVQGPLSALNDPARFGKSYVGGQLASAVPNIIKDVSKSIDPNQRESNDIMDYVQNSIPIARNFNTPKRDVLGNIIPQEPSGLGAFVDLFNSKTPIDNPVIQELDRLYKSGNEATPSKLQKKQTLYGQDFVLTPEQLNNLEEANGEQLRPLLEQAIKSPGYDRLSDEEKSKILDGVTKNVRIETKKKVLRSSILNKDTTVSESGMKAASAAEGEFDPSKVTGKFELEMLKDEFAESDKNFMRKNGKVFRKNEQGTVTITSEAKYDAQMITQRMERAKKNEDLQGWMKQAEEKFAKLQAQINDPNTDELDKETALNDIQDLITQYNKFKGYGGFTKPKKGKTTKVDLKLGDITSVDVPKTLNLKTTKINMEPPKFKPINLSQINGVRIKPKKIKVTKSTTSIPGARRLA